MGIHWNPCDVQVLKPGWNHYHHYISKFVLSSHRLSFSSSSSWHRIRISKYKFEGRKGGTRYRTCCLGPANLFKSKVKASPPFPEKSFRDKI
ncbi:hypothetical protein NC653_038259 [Populus alba x Populus x berolinensis]|uniref:Uncharacterized protein n=1 Tax=Populus alba x Populus x berolinensis TaxID=444605 RepID=A0AAD6PT16_9ROSI|nr:hypothetical protein NC653_038259 [Populus alba x Populus x berolinensis]